MKGLNSAPHNGSVHVTFNVSKDVASHIQQSVVGSWKRMQELGVVSIQLDKEQLMCDKSGLYTEMSEIRSAELQQHYSRLSCTFNGYTESQPAVDSCRRRSRGGRRGSRVSKQKRNDSSAACRNEFCRSAVPATSLVQQEMICKNSDNASQRINQDKEDAGLSSSEHVSFMSVSNVSSPQLPNHVSSFSGMSLSTKNPFIANKAHGVASAVTLNTVQSYDLPPPSTPFVPKRRKRRKPADGSSETVLTKTPSTTVTCVDHTMLPTHVDSGIETASYCTVRRFQLNGQYPRQFTTPMLCQYTVNNAQLMPLSFAGSPSPVRLANCAKLPTESQLMDVSSLSLSTSMGCLQTTTSEPKDVGIVTVKRNVQAGSNQLLQPSLGSSVSYPSCGQRGQLHQPAFSQVCGPSLMNQLSQGILDSRCRSPETFDAHAATSAETNVVSCGECFCRSANSQLQDVSLPLSSERNICPESNICSSTLRIKSTVNSSSLSSEVNRVDSLAPGLKLSETVSSSSVNTSENIQCSLAAASVDATTSVCGSSKNVNFVVRSHTVDNSPLVSSYAVVKKHKPDVMNGYHCMSDYTPAEEWHTSHLPVPPAVTQLVNKSNLCLSAGTSDDINNKYDFQTAVDRSVTKPAPNEEASQVAHTLYSLNMQSPHEIELCGSRIDSSQTISGWYDIFLFQIVGSRYLSFTCVHCFFSFCLQYSWINKLKT